MPTRTLTRADLVSTIYEEFGLSKTDGADLLEQVLDLIGDTLQAGEPVKLSTFGTFSVRHKAERMGRNPKTGEEAPIAARRVVVFKPSRNLKHVCKHPEDFRRKVPKRQIELFQAERETWKV
jgi:integration host factor subunit alpha